MNTSSLIESDLAKRGLFHLFSHPHCKLIGGNCNQAHLLMCGEQNPSRPAMIPSEVCSVALTAMRQYAQNERGLTISQVAATGDGDKATMRVINGEQIATVQRGNMTTSKPIIN